MFFKQTTAYAMRISDWSSDVCSSNLAPFTFRVGKRTIRTGIAWCCASSDLGRQPRRRIGCARRGREGLSGCHPAHHGRERESVVEGKSVSVRVDLGRRGLLQKKNINQLSL